jgi:tetratricopeptide (TPR) repeat protein
VAFGGETAESYYDEGLTALKKGNLDWAVNCFERALRLDPTFWAAHHQLGRCYLRIGETRRGIELLHRVLTSKPDHVPARLDLGHALLAAGRTQEAREQFRQILAGEPDHARAHLGLAHVCFHEADWSGAVTEAQAALLHGGPNFSALFVLGRAAKLAGDLALAQRSFDKADMVVGKFIELNPEQPEGHYMRGEVACARAQFSTALENYHAAELRADPQKWYTAFGESFTGLDILIKKGLCFQRLGKLDRARALGEEIVRLDPGNKLGQALKDL